ncbi:MAG: hypothetical protein ACHREM_00140 [Polyangiales bacterium]
MADKIKTDRKWRFFKSGSDVPKKTLRSEFDWVKDAEYDPHFIQHRGHWMHLSQFERTQVGGELHSAGWVGAHASGYFSGWVIKLSRDGEEYMIGTYSV